MHPARRNPPAHAFFLALYLLSQVALVLGHWVEASGHAAEAADRACAHCLSAPQGWTAHCADDCADPAHHHHRHRAHDDACTVCKVAHTPALAASATPPHPVGAWETGLRQLSAAAPCSATRSSHFARAPPRGRSGLLVTLI